MNFSLNKRNYQKKKEDRIISRKTETGGKSNVIYNLLIAFRVTRYH